MAAAVVDSLADPVTVTREGAVAVVTIANPPANALVHRVRAALLLAVAETEADRAVRAVVLCGAGGTFVGGDDIAAFDRQPLPPILPEVIRSIEAATKPWVAAIEGGAIGGGLELALGCHYRFGAPDARLGLPQVTLGLVPGAGGVVRLCRLVAPEEALALVAGGKPVTGRRAHDLGLVDAIAERDLLGAAIVFATDAPRRELPLPLIARRPVGEIGAAFDAAAARVLARARGQVAPAEAVAAIRDTLALESHEALAAERGRFLALLDAPQSRALRGLARAERAAAARIAPAALPTATVGVVGGGTMGAGIATAALLAGRRVTLVERDDAALARGLATIHTNLDGSVKRGVLDAAGHATALGRLDGSTGYAALADADLVIEAVFEDLAVKAEVFTALDRATRPGAILATNTSYLDVDRIAATVADPGRVVGLHFFAPAHVMKLVEVVRPAAVRPEVFATATAFARDLGKVPVESGVCDGFIGNRILTRYRQAMDLLLLEGALPWEIDAAMEGFGMAMGPYAVQDLSGLEIAWAGRQRMNVKARDDWSYVPIADRMVEGAKRLGRKAGAGWYDYADGEGKPSPEVEALIRAASAEAGLRRRTVPEGEIRRRALGAMVQEATRLLDEGIAARPSDVDLVLVHGYGFPRWRGGPMHWADAEGLRVVAATIDGFAVKDPRTWQVPALLRALAAAGGRFADHDG
jgi:3-hydroxyacyl-CoA dehydrogenase